MGGAKIPLSKELKFILMSHMKMIGYNQYVDLSVMRSCSSLTINYQALDSLG